MLEQTKDSSYGFDIFFNNVLYPAGDMVLNCILLEKYVYEVKKTHMAEKKTTYVSIICNGFHKPAHYISLI